MRRPNDNDPTEPATRPRHDSIAELCVQEECGQPQRGPGHPRPGWVHVKQAGRPDSDAWFCSWYCASRAAIHHELAGHDAHLFQERAHTAGAG